MENAGTLRSLVALRTRTFQKSRVAVSNQVDAIQSGRATATPEELATLISWYERLAGTEDALDKDIEAVAKTIPIIDKMTNVKGVGLMNASRVAALIDITKADTVSALWKYAGYGVSSGSADRPTKGERLAYNKSLKTACYLVGTAFLKSKSPYVDIYYKAKEKYQNSKPDWTKGHIHLASMRIMIKVWLSHLWETWRKLEGLPTRSTYIHEYGGHTHMYKPKDFGWEDGDG